MVDPALMIVFPLPGESSAATSWPEGAADINTDGMVERTSDGATEGTTEGAPDGLGVGAAEGEGFAEGDTDGLRKARLKELLMDSMSGAAEGERKDSPRVMLDGATEG
jgi:hypothetical protein